MCCGLIFRYGCGGSALMGIFGVFSLLKTTVGSRRYVAIANDEPLSLNVNEQPDERTPLLWNMWRSVICLEFLSH